jgi:hypothetical protein
MQCNAMPLPISVYCDGAQCIPCYTAILNTILYYAMLRNYYYDIYRIRVDNIHVYSGCVVRKRGMYVVIQGPTDTKLDLKINDLNIQIYYMAIPKFANR